MPQDTFASLRKIRLFEGLTDQDIKRLALIAERRGFGAGDELIREGELGSGMYVIKAGSVKVTKETPHDHEPERIATLGPGTYIGLNALIEEGERAATVVALESTTCLRLGFDELDRILTNNGDFARRFWQAAALGLSRQLRAANRSTLLLKEIARHREQEAS
jgi:CRP-like cAMP-binding protein